jgi:DNA polymerase III delta subunit
MLHVFFGNGAVAVRLKTFAFVASLEKDGYKLERIESDQYVQGTCTDIATSVSLFGGKTVYLLDTPSSDTLFNEEVIASLPLFKASENVFVIIEEKLLAPEKKVFAKYAESMEEITSAVEVRFNAFSMADSLANKDKKTLWLQLQDAKHAGLSAEEIIGTLWWQLKSMRLSKQTKSATEAGMKDFPYNKAKRALHNFKEGELEALSRSLLALYHDGHGGKKDIDLALEKWTLSI